MPPANPPSASVLLAEHQLEARALAEHLLEAVDTADKEDELSDLQSLFEEAVQVLDLMPKAD